MNKLHLTIAVFVLLPALSYSQVDTGIHFENGLTWQQVVAKATADHKYIFLDCFASWCGPCKQMDSEVYKNGKVGTYFNENFISVKVQIDTSAHDDSRTKAWYGDAHDIHQRYEINEFPTFLFFSPDGWIVHRGIGYKDTTSFVGLGADALDSTRQYYTLLRKYQAGIKDFPSMGRLALTVRSFGNIQLSNDIAREYKMEYLDTLNDSQLYTREIFEFIGNFTDLLNSKDKSFKLFYDQPARIDSMFYSGFSDACVKTAILKEEIDQKLWRNKQLIRNNPDWNKLYSTISYKYGKRYAESLVDKAAMEFYKREKNWPRFAACFEDMIRKHPPKQGGTYLDGLGDAWGLNVAAWDVFLNCSRRSVLTKALRWINLSIQLEKPENLVEYLDTKANLLYKLGRPGEAIAFEKKAIGLDNANAKKNGKDKGYMAYILEPTLTKMKNGTPTWLN